MKVYFYAFLALVAIMAGAAVYFSGTGNTDVEENLRNNPQGDIAKKVMLLTFPDGRTIPVNYLREGDKVYAGADGRWWREFREQQTVSLFIRGQKLTGQAKAILDDADYTHAVFSRLRPTVPTWLPDWLNGVLVEITLDQNTDVDLPVDSEVST